MHRDGGYVGVHACMAMWDEGNLPACEANVCTFQGVYLKLMDTRLLPAFMQCRAPARQMYYFRIMSDGYGLCGSWFIELGGYRWPRQANVSQTRQNVKKRKVTSQEAFE
jgi:hypothetical protein